MSVAATRATVTSARQSRESLYREVRERFSAPLERLAAAYEADQDRRRDLLQDVHAALWRSLEVFDERCSLRTWVYRVAHNVATTHLLRQRSARFVQLDELADEADVEATVERRLVVQRLEALARRLAPLDRQLLVLYLEGVPAAGIAEVTGLSPGNVATRVHRLKALLARRFHEGAPDA